MENTLNYVKEKLKVPRNLAIAAAVAGLVLGLIIGWVILPVQWTDASAEHLRADLRQDYLRNLITTFTLNGDKEKAVQLYGELGEAAESTLSDLLAQPGFLSTEQITRFTTALGIALPEASGAAANPAPLTLEDGTEIKLDSGDEIEPATKSNTLLWLGFGLLAILGVGAYLAYRYYFKERPVEEGRPLDDDTSRNRVAPAAARQPAAVPMRSAAEPAPAAAPVQSQSVFKPPFFGNGKQSNGTVVKKPVAQFMSTYVFGDDRYDESFTFDAPNGEFLGECGVSISDIIGVGEPKKISAFDIWLFDKNDIQTVTKVLMSKHSYEDPTTLQRLEIRGEPILAEPDGQFVLETATLRLEGRIVDVMYGDMPLPEDSYFQRSTVELAIYRK
jgi:hypothetical protein